MTPSLEAYSDGYKEQSMAELLKVENLKTQFNTEGGVVKAVDGISYHIDGARNNWPGGGEWLW